MRYFLDMEFIEDGTTIDLVSLGIVAQDGREFYVQNVEANLRRASQWVKDNVIPHLDNVSAGPNPSMLYNHPYAVYHHEIAPMVMKFLDVNIYGRPQFWGYYADYDWVAFCQLFGTMMQLPPSFPKYCMDIKQLCMMVGDPALPKQDDKEEHHALADARWNKKAFNWLNDNYTSDIRLAISTDPKLTAFWGRDRG